MPVYSYSQLSVYEECPLKYRLCYLDKIERDVEGIEGFVGLRVHETLKKCYDDARLTKLSSLSDLLAYYDEIWQKSWHDGIVIIRKDTTPEDYHALGRKLIETYYRRYAPFDQEITIGTELRLTFALDDHGRYRLHGVIDRLGKTQDGTLYIHDYKTGASLPGQEEIDNDRQLGLYQIGVQKKWPDIKNIKLVWHYLAFDHELVSSRSEQALARLTADTATLIDEIESATDFPPRESPYCEWCEYPDLCPTRKHLYKVEALPTKEYVSEPGVALVNRYAQLKEKAAQIEEEMEKVKEAIIDYARREDVTVIKGSSHKVRVAFREKLKFPGKSEPGRQELDKTIIEAGKWMEVSQLDTATLSRVVEEGLWDKKLINQIMKYGRLEESSTVHLSKLREEKE
jgi:putative RecB family exonuclease